MRTILLLMMMLLFVVGCGGKEDVPADPESGTTAVEEPATDGEEVAESEEAPQAADPVEEDVYVGPVGVVQLKDGTVLELTEFKKLGKYYLYISGKLNGRSSTVISFTRLRDLQRWGAFSFKDPYNFVITTLAGQQLNFIDSRIYIGSSSHEEFTFYTTNGLDKTLVNIRKADVASINITPPKRDD